MDSGSGDDFWKSGSRRTVFDIDRSMLMQLLQCVLMESRGQALEECECPVRQHEAQNLDTIKAAMLAHNPQDPEWCRYVRLSATRLQEHDALKNVCKEKCKGKGKSKRKEQKQAQRQREKQAQKQRQKAKARIRRRKEHKTRRTRNAPSCKGNDCLRSLKRPAEKKTVSHELSKLTMIDSDASIHVCPLKHGQGDGFRKSSETRPLPAAEMQQRGTRQMML